MSSKLSNTSIVLLIAITLWNGATAQSGCTTVLIGLSPCLNYITGNSSTPSSSCCSQLSNVVQTQPRCLCLLLNGGSSNLGISINQTLALALPGACHVQTPPVSQCNGGPTTTPIVPASSPSDSPADQTSDVPSTQSGSNIPSGTGSKTIPNTAGVVSGSNINAKFSFVGALILIASHSTISSSGF